MYFHIFNNKNQYKYYRKDKLSDHINLDQMKYTWNYSNSLKDSNIEFVSLYVQEKEVTNFLSSNDSKLFNELNEKIKKTITSLLEVNINPSTVNIYEYIPEYVLNGIGDLYCKASEHVVKNCERPKNYELLKNTKVILSEIKKRKLVLDLSSFPQETVQDKNYYNLISEVPNRIEYNLFGSVTGRLSTMKDTFPILTLQQQYRHIIKPTNDWLLETDFNASELRTALALLGLEQPKEDLHSWNLEHVFPRLKSRDAAKKRIFAWLYNDAEEENNTVYNKIKLKELYYKNGFVETPFDRKIECDSAHAVNYLIQSTSADLFYEQMNKIRELLKDKKSFIKFCNHDSLTIDLHSEDETMINELVEAFKNTRYGAFKVSVKGGKDWGNMSKTLVN